jgi:hypothetical protein
MDASFVNSYGSELLPGTAIAIKNVCKQKPLFCLKFVQTILQD